MNRKQLADQSGGSTLSRYDESFNRKADGDAEEAAPNVAASVWRWRWAVLSITIVFVIGAVIYLRVMPPSFTATARLAIDAPQNPMSTPGIGGPAESGDVFLGQQVTIMDSPVVCDEAARALRPTATQADLHTFSNRLSDSLSTDVGKKDNVITLSYTDKNADDAANNVKAIYSAYIDYVTKIHGDTSHTMIKLLEDSKTASEDQLNKILNKEIDFRQAHPEMAFTTQSGMNVVNNNVARLFDARTIAVLAQAKATAAYITADQLRDNLPQLEQFASEQNFRSPATTDEIAAARRDIDAANTRLLAAKGTYSDSNPFVLRDKQLGIELTAKLQILTKKLADEFILSLDQAKVQAEEQVKAIDAQIQASEHEAAAVNSLEGEFLRLQNTETSLRKQIEQFDQTIKAQYLVLDIGRLPNIRVLTPARGDDAVRNPDPARVLILTLAAGLAVGVGFSLLRDKLDQRVRSAEEIAALLGLPVIGVVPHMKHGLTTLARAQTVHWDPMSEVSEAYRAVRTAVHFGVQAGQARTIVVTSPTPSDGKSTLASNLAISFAQAGKRTLLLDADFRRPVQHRMFEIKDESGLTAVLAGHEPLAKAIHRTVVEGLDLLPAGPLPLNPSELLNGDSFVEILEELSKKYDHIVLDCPPVISVTDARILGAICDLSLLVLRAGKTTRQGAELARMGLMSVGSRLLGVVVNDVPRGDELYGYYGSYAYRGNGNERARLADEGGSPTNGHSSRPRRRLPSPSGVDSMQG